MSLPLITEYNSTLSIGLNWIGVEPPVKEVEEPADFVPPAANAFNPIFAAAPTAIKAAPAAIALGPKKVAKEAFRASIALPVVKIIPPAVIAMSAKGVRSVATTCPVFNFSVPAIIFVSCSIEFPKILTKAF